MPIISIIIPIFKVENLINDCLLSVISQDYPHIEIILIDDNSPDNSTEIAQELLKKNNFSDKTTFLKHPTNLGLSAARNTGLNIAKGDYVFFLDSDDKLSNPTAISSLVNEIKNTYSDIVVGHYKRVSNKRVISIPSIERNEYKGNKYIYKAYVKRKIPVMAWAKLIKKQFLLQNNLFFAEGLYHEDELWSFLIARHAQSVVITAITVYDYTIDRPGSITYEYTEKNISDLIKIFIKMHEIYIENPLFYPRETVFHLETFRRDLFLKLFKMKNKTNANKFIKEICNVRLPFISGSSKLNKQNLLTRLPTFLLSYFFKNKE